MFNNAGAKVKGYATTIFGITVGASVIPALAIWSIGSNYSDMSVLATLAGWLVIGAGALLGWLNSILLYAFGDLVENTAVVADTNRRILQKLIKNSSAGQTTPAPRGAAPVSGKWTCSCGEENSPASGFCMSCGAVH